MYITPDRDQVELIFFCLSHTYRHTHTYTWQNEMILVIVLGPQQVSCQKCDIFISVEDLAVNPRCPLSSVPDQTMADTRFITRKGGKNLFKKPLNQPLLNEKRWCQDLFVPQMALFSLLHSWLTTSRMLCLCFILINVLSSLLPLPPFIFRPTFSLSSSPLFPHYPILPFSFYSPCMNFKPSSHLGRQTFFSFLFFKEWLGLSGEGDGISC